MTDPSDETSRLRKLGDRLRSAREKQDAKRKPSGGVVRGGAGAMGLGVRIAVEMVAALAVGIGLGLALDHWLGTRPWMMLLFFVLGACAAFLNVIRTAREYDARARAARQARAKTGGETDREDERPGN